MQQEVSLRQIRQKVRYLHARLPQPVTAIQGAYVLPRHLREQVVTSRFSEESLQELSNDIGRFLGLRSGVRVKVGIESSEHLPAPVGSAEQADQVGLYKVRPGGYREIELTKKFRFELEHIAAILAHECTHNYLYSHGLEEADDSEDEILTDIAAAYLGLGGLLLEGYVPIVWTTETKGFWPEYTMHTIQIGYLNRPSIKSAIEVSAEIRDLRELLSSLPWPRRISASLNLKAARRERKARLRRLQWLQAALEQAKGLHDQAVSSLRAVTRDGQQNRRSHRGGKALFNLANDLLLGTKATELAALSEELARVRQSNEMEDGQLEAVSFKVDSILRNAKYWCRVARKLCG